MKSRQYTWIGLGLAIASGGCASDSASPPAATLSISLSAAALSLARGGSGSLTVTITRGGGFTGAVTLSVEGVPAAVAATPDPGSVASGSASATISVSVGAAAEAASRTLTVRAKGSGVSDATATFTLTVTPGSFTLALSPPALTIVQGANASTTVGITRAGGFTGAVALAVSGAPGGVATAFDPASPTGATSTLTLTVGQNVTAGSYTLTVRGTGADVTEQSVSLTLTVSPTAPGGSVTWTFCQATGLPAWLAFQDGAGAWAAVTPADNAYTFTIASGRGGIAYVISSVVDNYSLTVQYGTQPELAEQGAGQCADATGTKSLTGTVLNVDPAEQAFISFGGASAVVTPGAGTGFTLQNVLDGTRDLIAGRAAVGIGGSGVTITLNRGVILRGINPAAGSSVTVDFAGAQSFAPVTRNVTVNNLGADGAQIIGTYFTASGSIGTFYIDPTPAVGSARQYAGVPAAVQQAGDLHMLTVSAFQVGGVPSTFRTAVHMFKEAADRTVTLGPDIGAVTMTTAATAPYVRIRAQYTVQTAYNRFWNAGWTQLAGAVSRSAILAASSAYLGATAAFDFTLPDFSTVTGWNNLWGFVAGSEVTWQFNASGWSAAGGFSGSPNLEGAIALSGTRFGTITP